MTESERIRKVTDIITEGVTSRSIGANGITQISDWSPNNLKTLIICPDRVIYEYHVAPLGRMKEKINTEMLDVVNEPIKGSGKSILSVLSSTSRVFSNVEEIYIVQNTENMALCNQDIRISDMLPISQRDNIKNNLHIKFPRLLCIGILSSVDSVKLYKFMQLRFGKSPAPLVWCSEFKSLPVQIHPVLQYPRSYNYNLRFQYYMLDRTPNANEHDTSSAQLYTHFQRQMDSYNATIKNLTEKNECLNAKVKLLNLLSDTVICSWLHDYARIPALYAKITSDQTWVVNRLKVFYESKLPTVSEELQNFLKHLKGVKLCNLSEYSQCILECLQNGLCEVLLKTDPYAMQSWLFKGAVINERNESSESLQLSEKLIKELKQQLYLYICVEHACLITSIMNYVSVMKVLDIKDSLEKVVIDSTTMQIIKMLQDERILSQYHLSVKDLNESYPLFNRTQLILVEMLQNILNSPAAMSADSLQPLEKLKDFNKFASLYAKIVYACLQGFLEFNDSILSHYKSEQREMLPKICDIYKNKSILDQLKSINIEVDIEGLLPNVLSGNVHLTQQYFKGMIKGNVDYPDSDYTAKEYILNADNLYSLLDTLLDYIYVQCLKQLIIYCTASDWFVVERRMVNVLQIFNTQDWGVAYSLCISHELLSVLDAEQKATWSQLTHMLSSYRVSDETLDVPMKLRSLYSLISVIIEIGYVQDIEFGLKA